MAGESLSLSELKGWYTSFNNVIKAYGGGAIAALSTPDGGVVVPADINNLYSKITEFKNDTYFKTQPSLYPSSYTNVTSGSKVSRSAITPITTAITGINKIKCRNNATNNYGTHTHGEHGNVTCTNTWWSIQNSNGTRQHGGTCAVAKNHRGAMGVDVFSFDTNGNNWNTYCSWTQHSHGTYSHSQKSNSYKSNTTVIDILNAHTPKTN